MILVEVKQRVWEWVALVVRLGSNSQELCLSLFICTIGIIVLQPGDRERIERYMKACGGYDWSARSAGMGASTGMDAVAP